MRKPTAAGGSVAVSDDTSTAGSRPGETGTERLPSYEAND